MNRFDNYVATKGSVWSDEDFMMQAISAAERAKYKGDRPVGALLAISPAKSLVEHDTSVTEESPLNTATMNVLRKAFDLTPRKVANSVLYCTVEPDATSVALARDCGINEIVFGCYNLRNGFRSKPQLLGLSEMMSYKHGVLAKECFEVLNDEMKEECSIDEVL